MSHSAIAVVRWALLACAVLNVLQATVLQGAFQRWVFRPWLALNERAGGRVPPLLRSERMHRAWPLLMALVFVLLRWYLGTSQGAALLGSPRRATHRARCDLTNR